MKTESITITAAKKLAHELSLIDGMRDKSYLGYSFKLIRIDIADGIVELERIGPEYDISNYKTLRLEFWDNGWELVSASRAPKFKIDDKVICINDAETIEERKKFYYPLRQYINCFKEYVVSGITEDGGLLLAGIDNGNERGKPGFYGFNPDRFELAPNNSKR